MPTRQRNTPAAKVAAQAGAKPAVKTAVKTPVKAAPVVKRPAAKAVAPTVAKVTKPVQTAQLAKVAKPSKPSKPAKADKPAKVRRKPVRDSFTMPEADFALIATLKARALSAQREVKKSELLRAGLHALAALTTPALVAAIAQLEPVKIGRPKKA
jgi:hypothetical protein